MTQELDPAALEALKGYVAARQSVAPKNYQAQLYRSPIDLPECTAGRFSVKHKILVGLTPIVGLRQAISRGCQPVSVTLESPVRMHELVEEGQGTWMADSPEELNQIAEALNTFKPAGTVLVGGLGLGVLAAALAARKGVGKVTVVERSPWVIELCEGEGYEVISDDILTYLRFTPQEYDCYMLDTWQGTGETTWWDEVLPLRRVIRNRWGARPRIHCWAEDIMLGQVRCSLLGPHRVWKYKKLPRMDMAEAMFFTEAIGLPGWEHKYGALLPSEGESGLGPLGGPVEGK